MARATIDNVRSTGHIAEIYRWRLGFAQFPEVGSWPSSEALDFRCESVELPKQTQQKIENNIRGHKVHYPGIANYASTATIVFVETVDNTIAKIFKEWREICWQVRTGAQYSKSQVEATILITRMNHLDEDIWEYTLKGCFYEDSDLGTLDGVTSDAIKPSLTLSYDYFTDRELS